ncbi:hypothetical protein (nucleomorph) [Guillardia theta]|uniref:Uncharacterized protein n=1 Tax=Guillardia theta TaxID=55529 RepID=Q98SC2_GUITH|nr:hypothetical protein GTHECHR3017 [Guillardia theta]AAK39661.1 hypothetical protein [Guillardia theta]|mmetsp:Transcript_48896/g.153580  ORF Transcript_48896/g.153580 Transcript_48896/m.153580 type:complete len:358 (-) Transcript_48896:4082-5155(-)
MFEIFKIKFINKHNSNIWDQSWSSYGNYLISISSDQDLKIYGPLNCSLNHNLTSSYFREYFKNWGLLSNLKLNTWKRSLKTLLSNHSNNLMFLGSFNGKGVFFKFKFIKKKKFFYMIDFIAFLYDYSEIKDSIFLTEDACFSISSRNKSISIWKKNDKNSIECLYHFDELESEVKSLAYDNLSNSIIAVSFNGYLYKFVNKDDNWIFGSKLKFSLHTIWSVYFLRESQSLIFTTNDGEIFMLKNKVFSQMNKYYFGDQINVYWEISKQSNLKTQSSQLNNLLILTKRNGFLKILNSKTLISDMKTLHRHKCRVFKNLVSYIEVGLIENFDFHPLIQNIISFSSYFNELFIFTLNFRK